MLIDTHCHVNMMVKKEFDTILTHQELERAKAIAQEATTSGVTTIINVGTSLIESRNCVTLARTIAPMFAVIGIHPNDLTPDWQKDLKELQSFLKHTEENKIVGIGECGMDFHYPEYDAQRQRDAFKAQIEIALENNVGLVVHTRSAPDETLRVLEEFKGQITRGIIHCFSEDKNFAKTVVEWNFAIGIGGIITYPKNNYLREIVASTDLASIVLETDAPFLPIQSMRGKQNHPKYIRDIAEFIGTLRNESLETVAAGTTATAQRIFGLKSQI